MNPTRCKKSAAQWSGDLAVWLRENSETNDLQMERLRRNLRRARQQELTSRQRQVVELYFDQGLNMTQIGCRLGVHRSTVSRTLQRGKGTAAPGPLLQLLGPDFSSCGFLRKPV